ncbi:hypothetical protein [Fusobacterium mortiferum]|uniref:Uncharacterized protein n=1 Tax=Fusobacterium mortiferum TaxID=850 RepID=A0ABS2FZS9_FUSMR|nr:hypothetical protein [Fusobacterium mortiferum]MBM6690460.1 hypothetical protein [Fusobacterium mortiferum]MBM6874475.1 hypothetical protein [Fusobacterium mortiferum]
MIKQLKLYNKENREFKEMLQEMEYLKSKGLVDEWKLVEEDTLISYSGKYRNIGYGGKIKIREYKEVYKHIIDTINCYSWEGARWN